MKGNVKFSALMVILIVVLMVLVMLMVIVQILKLDNSVHCLNFPTLSFLIFFLLFIVLFWFLLCSIICSVVVICCMTTLCKKGLQTLEEIKSKVLRSMKRFNISDVTIFPSGVRTIIIWPWQRAVRTRKSYNLIGL